MIAKFKEKQRLRCLLLAIHLETVPKGYRHFNMASFFRRKDDDESNTLEAKYAKENGGVDHCGTTACAVGHGPSAGIYVPDSMVVWHDNTYRTNGGYWSVDWQAYSKLFSGDFDDDKTGQAAVLFEWMFGGGWEAHDNHHWGAAARIRYALAGKEIPEGFDSDDDARRSTRKLYRAFDKRYTETV